MLDGSAVSVADRRACGSDLSVTGCQSCRRATNQHSPPVIPPACRQRGGPEFSSWHPHPTASSPHPPLVWEFTHRGFRFRLLYLEKCRRAGSSSNGAAVFEILIECLLNGWFGWSDFENVYLGGKHTGAGRNYTNCQTTSAPFLQLVILPCDGRASWRVFTSKLLAGLPFSPSDRWHLEGSGRCMCHLYPRQGQTVLRDLQDTQPEQRYGTKRAW